MPNKTAPNLENYDVVLFPTYAQALAYRKQVASHRAEGLFGKEVTTFGAWVSSLWERYGDGRALVSTMQRQVFMALACGTDVPEGYARVAATCVQQLSGFPSFEQALSSVAATGASNGLTEAECGLFKYINTYRTLLTQQGLVEPGVAQAILADTQEVVFSSSVKVAVLQQPLTPQQEWFFQQLESVEVAVFSSKEEGIVPAREEVDVRFAFPSGRYATPRLLADVVRAFADEGNVLITSKEPSALYEALAPALYNEGIPCALVARKPLIQTAFGAAYLSLYRAFTSEPWDKAAFIDFLYSPFSGLSSGYVRAVDKSIRFDRLASREEWFAQLRAKNPVFTYMEELMESAEADVVLPFLEEQVYKNNEWDDLFKREQVRAIGALRDISAAVRAANVDDEQAVSLCVALLTQASVDISQATDEGPTVFISSFSDAVQVLDVCLPATVVLSDMTNVQYPARTREDLVSVLRDKLDIVQPETTQERLRRQFNQLVLAAQRHLVITRPLNDEDANPTYAASMVEEFIDSYREDPSAIDDISNPYSLPDHLQKGMFLQGEEEVYQNASSTLSSKPQALLQMAELHDIGYVSQANREAVVVPRPIEEGVREVCLSPSQIETYLESPFGWFANSRLQLEEFDEQWGPLPKGSFAHAALERFYRAFKEQGFAKVDKQNVEQAKALMKRVLAQLEAEQPLMEPGSGRLVPLGALETAERDEFERQILRFLDFETKMLPSFYPEFMEIPIPAKLRVPYAGVLMTGRVDRIDVDDLGRAVIVDYKSSVYASHNYNKPDAFPSKVQALIYAQMVQRLADAGYFERPLKVVGALYVSYGQRKQIRGTYDGREIASASLPNCNRYARCGSKEGETFPELLDLTEQRLAPVIEAMLAGRIPADPASLGIEGVGE